MTDVEQQIAERMANLLRTWINEIEALIKTGAAPNCGGARLALLRDLLADLKRPSQRGVSLRKLVRSHAARDDLFRNRRQARERDQLLKHPVPILDRVFCIFDHVSVSFSCALSH
jgi:hypothetical protein